MSSRWSQVCFRPVGDTSTMRQSSATRGDAVALWTSPLRTRRSLRPQVRYQARQDLVPYRFHLAIPWPPSNRHHRADRPGPPVPQEPALAKDHARAAHIAANRAMSCERRIEQQACEAIPPRVQGRKHVRTCLCGMSALPARLKTVGWHRYGPCQVASTKRLVSVPDDVLAVGLRSPVDAASFVIHCG